MRALELEDAKEASKKQQPAASELSQVNKNKAGKEGRGKGKGGSDGVRGGQRRHAGCE